MAEDLEVGVKLTVDDQELENIQDQELGFAGGAGQSDQMELDEERNEKLQVMSRGIGRVASRLGALTAIAATLAVIAKLIGDALNIRFEDVRSVIVEAMNLLKDSILQLLPGGGRNAARNNPAIRSSLGNALAPVGGQATADLFLNALDIQSERVSSQQNNQNINLFTSRDSILGDSTQQELEGKATDEFGLIGGASGGSIPE